MAATIQVTKETDKNVLLMEAKMQSNMIENLQLWLKALLALSGIGIVLVWWSFNGDVPQLPTAIAGVLLTIAGFFGILMVQRGIVNGKKNVERIMNIADKIDIPSLK